MAYETEPGKGTIWQRERRTDKHPVMGGQICCPKCKTKLDAALWFVTDRDTNEKRKDKHGKPFFSVKLRPDDEKYERNEETQDDETFPI